MNNIELLVKHTGDINFTRLDLFGDETISLTQVVQDVKDPGKVFTNFSKTFSLPASKTNNKFFKHYENFTQDVAYSFDARKKVQAKIELNSLPFQQGKLRLEGVDLKNGRPNIYRVTFFGSLNLKDILGDLKLSDLDWLSNFDTTYTSSSLIAGMSSSGTGSVTVDSVAYPVPLVTALISNTQRGFYSSSNTAKYFNTTDEEVNKAGGNLNPSNNVLSGYYFKDLTFSIRLYLIIKAIENSQSVKARNNNNSILFSTDFFSDTNVSFYNLYMLCQRNAGKKVDGFGSVYVPNQQSGKDYDNATNEHEENLVLRESTFEIYGLSSSQNFGFGITINFGSISQNIQVQIKNINSGDIEYATWTSSQTGQTRTYQLGNGTYELRFTSTAQQTVTSFSLTFTDTFATSTTTTIATSDVDANFIIPGTNTSFLIQDNIPEMKVIDFLSGLFKLFNLTAIEENGKITVKTLDSFYTGGTLRNITEFVDTTSKSVNKALPYKEIVFKYEDTENILAKQHREINQRDWGAISYNTGEVLDSNNNTYEIVAPFQHMKFERLVDGSTTKNIQVGHLLNDKLDPYLGKPVIFYPIHSSNLGVTADGFNFITEIDGYDGGSSDTDSTQSVYWIPSNSPVVLSSGSGYPETINFNVELNEFTNGDDYTDSLFQKYYQSYIVNAFRFNERLTKIKARLPLKFLEQFTLADELQIVDLVYRINSITTNLQTGESTLELLNGREAIAATGSAYASVTISTSSNATPSTACGYTLNNTLYYTGTLGNGVRLYTDTGLTTAFSGTGNNYAFPGSNYAAIDSNGYISGYQACPTLPPTVQTNSTTSITFSSFTMNGNISVANGTISQRGFYWGVNSNYASNTKVAEGGTATGTFSKSITSGVTAGQTYYITAYAINGNGEGRGATISFTASNAPNLPTVNVLSETNVTAAGFTARLEITNDGGATIDAAGFWIGTNNTAYNASGNTHYSVSPAPTSIGIQEYSIGSLNASTTYYYWATASNTYSSSDGISTSYETVTTLALAYSYNNITYDALDAYYACISNSPQTYYSTSSTFQAGIALYSNSNLSSSFLVPNGYYARNNKSYQVQNTNGILGAETQCSTTTVFRIRITFDYPSTNYYDMTTVKNQTLSTTSVMYFAVSFTSGRIMYTDVGLTTPYSGLGSFKTDRGATAFNYQRYPENKMFMARRQNLIGGVWTDLTSTATDSGYADYICQISSSGEIQILYWDYANTSFNISGSAGLTGIKISTSGSSDAATACNTPAFTIVYFKGTNLGNGTVIYTDSASAGTVSSSNKLNGGGNWYKFENNYRAQISSTGVVSNYASC
tara:strand:+ start:591 stop:4562 length:3972 start_codon:yes stop_codon:yes gene_type:complete